MTTEKRDPSRRVVVCPSCQTKNRVPAAARGAPRCGACHSPLGWIADATDADFTEVVERATIPVLVDIWAPWCGPCRTLSPALEQLTGEMAGQLKLVKVNTDENPQVSRRFNIMSIPTLLLFNEGEILDQQVGAAPIATLRTWLQTELGARA
ncbi:MAG: Thioredoxin [Marmoricola sp.]|jgi:thioredoxin 2|nr:Thioredoxin [Marmoricola sp.]